MCNCSISTDTKSQISLTESSPSVVKPTETLDAICTVTGASLTDSSKIYSVEWVRQYPGKGLEWLGRVIYNGDLYYAQSLKGRITITRDTSKGNVYLKLSNMNVNDSGRYYCARATLQQSCVLQLQEPPPRGDMRIFL